MNNTQFVLMWVAIGAMVGALAAIGIGSSGWQAAITAVPAGIFIVIGIVATTEDWAKGGR